MNYTISSMIILDNCYLAETHSLQQTTIYSVFTHCGNWHLELLAAYLADNVAFVKSEIEKHCPLISIMYGSASYLLFLNAKK